MTFGLRALFGPLLDRVAAVSGPNPALVTLLRRYRPEAANAGETVTSAPPADPGGTDLVREELSSGHLLFEEMLPGLRRFHVVAQDGRLVGGCVFELRWNGDRLVVEIEAVPADATPLAAA